MKFTPFISVFIMSASLFTYCKKDKDEFKKEEDTTLNKPHLNSNLKYGTVTDIDGNQYATIQIGTQTWMAENLNTSTYNDGSKIHSEFNDIEWGTTKNGAYSIYDNSLDNQSVYGKLYNWYTVNTGILCPKGWHIPSNVEWIIAEDFLGGYEAGGKMKSIIGWTEPNIGATNESGFSGQAGGQRGVDGKFQAKGEWGYWWSSTESSDYINFAWIHYLSDSSDLVYNIDLLKNSGYSCRCLKD